MSGKDIQYRHNLLYMSRISISAVLWACLLPRRGRSGRRLDFYGKHHASSSEMSAAWWLPYQVESASKTNFYIRKKPVNHKVPLRGTYNVQLKDQAANLSEVLAWSFSLKSVLRTANIFRCSPGHSNDKNLTNLIFIFFNSLVSRLLGRFKNDRRLLFAFFQLID